MKPLLTVSLVVSLGIMTSEGQLDSAVANAKCTNVAIRFPDAPEPVYVLNARAVDRDSLPPLGGTALESVEVVCADYIYETFGIKARKSGVVIFTSPGPHAALNASMDSIAVLQSAYAARTGAFASTLDELGWSDETGLMTVELSVLEGGARWTATGTHRYLGRRVPLTVGGARRQPRH